VQFVFQILAQLLESSPPEAVSDHYKGLLEPLLSASQWDTRGNVPACTRLLCAVIPRGARTIIDGNKLEPLLGIFQKLLASRNSDLYAFDLLDSVIKAFEP
jgi:exportin-2 (importin alpha re-exporter)